MPEFDSTLFQGENYPKGRIYIGRAGSTDLVKHTHSDL
jgi:hypothetical protein